MKLRGGIFSSCVGMCLILFACTQVADSRNSMRATAHDVHFQSPTGFTSDSAMVVSAHPEATRVGVEVLRRGGNAADAAVAVHFALAVSFPYAGNIGGGGFLLYHGEDGNVAALDFRETAPSAASRDMYLDKSGEVVPGKSVYGALSAGVPGSVAGMAAFHEKYGSVPWKELLEYAVALADTGFSCTESDALWLNKTSADFRRYNPRGAYLVKEDGWIQGDRVVQRDLAATLRRIQSEGRDGFYAGETAKMIVEEMAASGGIISAKDLAGYQPVWRKPLMMESGTWSLYTMPPPSGGGLILIQSLQMLKDFPLRDWGPGSPETVHVIAEVLKRAFADRTAYVGDPAFVEVPAWLTEQAYLDKRRAGIRLGRATPGQEVRAGSMPESEETTHFSIVDSRGNAVSATTTINGPFGSKVWVKGAGFLLNNEMDDFSVKPGHANQFGLRGNDVNAIVPGKRMASSMSPTIITRNGRISMVIGTPGGSTIPVSILQCILNVYVHGMSMQVAVAHLRFHHQGLPDEIAIEDGAFPDATWHGLRLKGHQVCLRDPIGRVNAILVHPDGLLEGGADPRRDDCAGGF